MRANRGGLFTINALVDHTACSHPSVVPSLVGSVLSCSLFEQIALWPRDSSRPKS